MDPADPPAVLAEADVVLLPKPQPGGLAELRDGRVLWGWPHCVQGRAISPAGYRLEAHAHLIAFEAMIHWTGDRGLPHLREGPGYFAGAAGGSCLFSRELREGFGAVWQDSAVTITAAADGSALGNPGPAGWAWYVNDDCWRAGGWPHGTNNQGELMAVLDLFRSTAHLAGEDLHILCDSQYVINSVTKWMPGWKRKGWRKSDGKPVLNVELLKEIDQELRGRKYTFEWVRGHAGHDLNEAADERARAAATSYQQGVAVRQGPGFGPAAERPGEAVRPAAATLTATAPGAAPATLPRTSARPGQQEFFGSGFEEPDLFSELEEEATPAPGTDASPEAIVEALERELLRPETRADLGRTGVLLHPDFTEIGSSGRIWTRDAMMLELEEGPEGTVELELLGADRIGENTVLLTYRSYTRSGTTLRSSLWVREGAQWRLRFHQGTPEA